MLGARGDQSRPQALLQSCVILRETLLNLRVEPGEGQLVQLPQVGRVGSVHVVEPSPRVPWRDRRRAFHRSAATVALCRAPEARGVGNALLRYRHRYVLRRTRPARSGVPGASSGIETMSWPAARSASTLRSGMFSSASRCEPPHNRGIPSFRTRHFRSGGATQTDRSTGGVRPAPLRRVRGRIRTSRWRRSGGERRKGDGGG